MSIAARRRRGSAKWPVCMTNCADCGVGTMTLGEYYMVKNTIWEEAWLGRRRSWGEFLCIGCLEGRLGRRLVRGDFTDAPVNKLNAYNEMSDRLRDRLRDRLTATQRIQRDRVQREKYEAAMAEKDRSP